MLNGKEDIVTLEEVQAELRTKALTKLKGLKVDDSGEGLSVSRGKGGSRGNLANLKNYKNASALVVCCLEEGGVSHLGNDHEENGRHFEV
ncbi:hypothetical protein MTR_8g067970 [Medicago truncatula]|uniref:Uncharacterized protein n=1 Tax=Medicago truncatula TaxID=3880 RepID=G7LIH5_MEDTR|nr:hypothetical protein MTR_8g067970 [Medicago truncatula]